LRRPSSLGPQLVNEVTPSVSEFTAPTVMWFLALAGGATVRYVAPQKAKPWRSLPTEKIVRNGAPRLPRTMASMRAAVVP